MRHVCLHRRISDPRDNYGLLSRIEFRGSEERGRGEGSERALPILADPSEPVTTNRRVHQSLWFAHQIRNPTHWIRELVTRTQPRTAQSHCQPMFYFLLRLLLPRFLSLCLCALFARHQIQLLLLLFVCVFDRLACTHRNCEIKLPKKQKSTKKREAGENALLNRATFVHAWIAN